MANLEPEQLSRYFSAHARELVLFARQWVHPAEAEDIIQDVFIRLIRQSEPPRNIKAWLFRAVRNAALSQSRTGHSRCDTAFIAVILMGNNIAFPI